MTEVTDLDAIREAIEQVTYTAIAPKWYVNPEDCERLIMDAIEAEHRRSVEGTLEAARLDETYDDVTLDDDAEKFPVWSDLPRGEAMDIMRRTLSEWQAARTAQVEAAKAAILTLPIDAATLKRLAATEHRTALKAWLKSEGILYEGRPWEGDFPLYLWDGDDPQSG
jgi:hypothetical protein